MENDDCDGAAFAVDVGEYLGSHSCVVLDVNCRWVKNEDLTIGSQCLESTCGAERAGVGHAHDGDQDHGVEDGGKDLDACQLDSNNEWRATRFRAGAAVQWAVGRHNQADEEEVDDVEDADTPDDLFGGFGDLLLGICGLCGC